MKDIHVYAILISSFFWILPIFFIGDYLKLDFTLVTLISFVILIPIWIYCMTWGTRQQIKRDKDLEKENKYERGILCSNCNVRTWFVIDKGICLNIFLKDKKCSECECDFKIKEIM